MSAEDHIAVYTGSFDPFHLGHEDIVRRAARLYEKVIVGVGVNPDKRSLFTPEDRVQMIQEALADVPNVEVRSFGVLTVTFAREMNSRLLLRGIRALADIEYEFTMTLTNSSLDADVETVFLMAHREYTHLSSTLIRQIAELGGNLNDFVPSAVRDWLTKRFPRAASPKERTKSHS